jgi:putative membrane protein
LLFVVVAVLSIVPTLEFASRRGPLKVGKPPTIGAKKLRLIRAILHLELVGVVSILLFAALMARGIGLMP